MQGEDISKLKTELAEAEKALAQLEAKRAPQAGVEAFKAHRRAVADARDVRDWLVECVADAEKVQAAADRQQRHARLLSVKAEIAKARSVLLPIAEKLADSCASAMAAIVAMDTAVTELQSKHLEAHVLTVELGITDRDVSDATDERYQRLARGLAFALQALRCTPPASKSRMPLALDQWTRASAMDLSSVLQLLGASSTTSPRFSVTDQLRAAIEGTHWKRVAEIEQADSARREAHASA